ncbi:MAG: ABC transporter permease [Clostridiales bacterium]|nr:ABC transporter permease [Clostridiales bacterium]
MKGRGLGYLIREGVRSLWSNRNMSLASIAVLLACLVLMGASLLFMMNVGNAFRWLESQNIMMVYVESGVDDEGVTRIEQQIKGSPNIAACEFISKEQALKNQIEAMGENGELLLYDDSDNIFPDTFKVTVADLEQYEQTYQAMSSINGIESVSDTREQAQTLNRITQTVGIISIWVIGLLVLVSLFIIANTIKLTMYMRRLEISIMKSVGATDGFVTVPFVVQGMALGVLATIFSMLLLWGLYELIAGAIDVGIMRNMIPFGSVALPLCGLFLLVGVLAGAGGSAISIRKYLKKGGGGVYDVI